MIISTAAAAKEVFQTGSNDLSFSSRPKGLFFEIVSDNYKTLVVTPYGPYWRQLRKLSRSELFSPKRHNSYRGVREEELKNMMALLLEKSQKGEPVNVKSWLYEVSANVMTKMLINKRLAFELCVSQSSENWYFSVLKTLKTLKIRTFFKCSDGF